MEGEMQVLIPDNAETFKCPKCGKYLEVPRRFVSCPCGRWLKTILAKKQNGGWGCGEDLSVTCMILRPEKTPLSFFSGMFDTIYRERSPIDYAKIQVNGRQ